MRKVFFNDMVQQTRDVIEGRITQFRSIISPHPTYDKRIGVCWKGYAYGIRCGRIQDDYMNFVSGTEYNRSCRRFRVGEVVAVAQSYKTIREALPYSERAKFYCDVVKAHFPDSATHKDYDEIAGWHNKMFVKAEYMPHKICIKSVRMERLRDISDEDCLKSGVVDVEPRIKGAMRLFYPCEHLKSVAKEVGWGRVFSSPRLAFASLFEKINGDGTWVRDPYVWVYDFELLK